MNMGLGTMCNKFRENFMHLWTFIIAGKKE